MGRTVKSLRTFTLVVSVGSENSEINADRTQSDRDKKLFFKTVEFLTGTVTAQY